MICLHIKICSMKTNSKSVSSGTRATAFTGTSKKKMVGNSTAAFTASLWSKEVESEKLQEELWVPLV